MAAACVGQLLAAAQELGAQFDPGADTYHAVRAMLAHVFYGYGDGAQGELGFDEVHADYRPFWALAWLRNGRVDDARRVLFSYSQGNFQQPMIELLRLGTWAVLGELSAELNEPKIARQLYDLLAPHDGTHFLLHASVYLGPASYYLAILSAVDGRESLAEQHFNAALDQANALCALPFVARIRHVYVAWLGSRDASSLRARELLTGATQLARGLGVVLAS